LIILLSQDAGPSAVITELKGLGLQVEVLHLGDRTGLYARDPEGQIPADSIARIPGERPVWPVVLLCSVALGAALWTPPVIDQVAHSPGNLDVIRDYFSHPPDSPIGSVSRSLPSSRARPIAASRSSTQKLTVV